MISPCTTISSFDLESLIYSSCIYDNLESNSNLELNQHKILTHKVCFSFHISFFHNALSYQPYLNISFDSVIISAICFLILIEILCLMDIIYAKINLNSNLDLNIEAQKKLTLMTGYLAISYIVRCFPVAIYNLLF